MLATPTLSVTNGATFDPRCGIPSFETTVLRLSAMARAVSMGVPGRMHPNSSPPYRARMSVFRRRGDETALATERRHESPAWWP